MIEIENITDPQRTFELTNITAVDRRRASTPC